MAHFGKRGTCSGHARLPRSPDIATAKVPYREMSASIDAPTSQEGSEASGVINIRRFLASSLKAHPVLSAVVGLLLIAPAIPKSASPSNSVSVASSDNAQYVANRQAFHLDASGMRCDIEFGFVTVSGTVTNATQAPLRSVMAVASHYSSDGTFIRSDSALVEYDPLMPGQTSPYKVMSRYNPMMISCRVEFKLMFGGRLQIRPE